jgi:hypothetical protein
LSGLSGLCCILKNKIVVPHFRTLLYWEVSDLRPFLTVPMNRTAEFYTIFGKIICILFSFTRFLEVAFPFQKFTLPKQFKSRNIFYYFIDIFLYHKERRTNVAEVAKLFAL